MKQFCVCGLGNAIVDIFLDLGEAEFQSLGFERGTMRLVDKQDQDQLLSRFHDGRHDLVLVSGGSVANSVIAVSQLGGKSAFIGCVGDDRYGLHYVEEFQQLQIDMGNPVLVGESTGTCLAIVTPEGERTMRTFLGIASHLSDKHVDEQRIAASQWLFIEGYVFANPDTGQHAIRKAIQIAKASGTKVALTCSDGFIPEVFGDAFRAALEHSDLLFCNAGEALSVTGASDVQQAFARLGDMVPGCVVTNGPDGAYVRMSGQTGHAPTQACDPRDLTGAGDMFAGSFLYGITHGYQPLEAAKAANGMARRVIMQVGARLHDGVRHAWQQALEQ
ncbi:MAG: adenosine kinase [Pirellulaceae bacterium]|nr:adenosine kinase [Pirellulaceae bacterium]